MMADDQNRSNTTEKQRGGITGKGFVAGDKRINRRGRPKTFEALRAEAVKLAGEILTAKTTDGREVAASRVNMILLDWATSKDPRKQELFISYAYGKVPNRDEHTGKDGGPIQAVIKVKAFDYGDSVTSVAPRPVANSEPPSEDKSNSDG